MAAEPPPTRGVLFPSRLPSFQRIPAPPGIAALVRWFWIPEWDLDPGETSRQHVIGFPACNLVVSHDKTELAGPTTHASFRDLTGKGWAVGALLRPAAVPHLTVDPGALRDTSVVVEFPELTESVHQAMALDIPPVQRHRLAVAAFVGWLKERAGPPSPEALLANRLVDIAETRHDLMTVAELAGCLHLSVRSLQRLTARYVGLPAATLIRRRRLQEAAERVRQQPDIHLGELASELGYADHAHLTHEWRSVLGFTPSSYRREEA